MYIFLVRIFNKQNIYKSFLVLLLSIEIILNCQAYKLNDPPPLCSAYEMLIVNTKQCVSRCPIRCMNDLCFEEGECPCENSYMTNFDIGLVCGQQCLPGCIEAGGYCAGSQVCVCPHKGTYFDPVSRKCWHVAAFQDKCRGRCLYGHCDPEGNCNCYEGFRYNNNLFGQLCSPICKQDCGGRGYCFLPNMCACRKKHYHYQSDGRCHKEDDYIF